MLMASELYCRVEVFKDEPVLGRVRMRDGGGFDQIVVCVAAGGPAWYAVECGEDLSADVSAGAGRFAASRRAPATIAGWLSRDDATTAIDDAAAHWAATLDGRG
jgi:inorganic pyrophosphatase